MRIAFFSTQSYERAAFDAENRKHGHDITYIAHALDPVSASLAHGFPAVCVFVNDQVDADTIAVLAAGGTTLIALRSAGFNNVDLKAAAAKGIDAVRVPAYSPYSVAEFAIGLLLCLDRKIHRAWARVREDNFALEGLLGHDLHGRTVGVVGTGRIGALVAKAYKAGFGCQVLASDVVHDSALTALGIEYVPIDELVRHADIITLHCPLTPETVHLINASRLAQAKPGVTLVNTSRGALVDTAALIDGLKSGHVGGVALDVYEKESELFFEDRSLEVVQDDTFQRLLTFPNMLVTGHQAFFTADAMAAIASTTLASVGEASAHVPLTCAVGVPLPAAA